jgi:hypothetical protein
MLYELGVPLELIIKREGGFGVGWDDAKTAITFYWRLSQERIMEFMTRAKSSISSILYS